MQCVKIMAQLANHTRHQVHHEGVTVDFSQIRDISSAWRTNARQIVTRQVDQHQMFR
ncbi:hypothetical protein D3C81_1913670 [compost metagenome]